MDTTKIDVNNKEEIKVFVINNVELRIINLSLGRYVDVSVVLKQGNEFVSAQNFRIEGQEYDDWGNFRYRDWETDRKSTRLNSSHLKLSRMPSSA